MGATKQRTLVLEILRNSGTLHPSADMVFEEAKKRMPHIGLGTIYRNLNYLVDDGEIMRIAVPGEPDRFDKTAMKHGHAICRKCGAVFDFDFDDGDENDIAKMVQKRLGDCAVVEQIEMNIGCLCNTCKTSQSVSSKEKLKEPEE